LCVFFPFVVKAEAALPDLAALSHNLIDPGLGVTMRGIMSALCKSTEYCPQLKYLFPLHLSTPTLKALFQLHLNASNSL
jgi:hypothetical protein